MEGLGGSEQFHLLVDLGGLVVTASCMDGVFTGVLRKLVAGQESGTAISQAPGGTVARGHARSQKVRMPQKVSEPSRPVVQGQEGD